METNTEINTAVNTNVNGTGTQAPAAPEAKKEPTMQDIARQFFAPAELAQGAEAANIAVELATKAGAKPVYNFDPAAEFPNGYGIAIIPISKRDKDGTRGNVVENVCIAAIPEPSLIESAEGGNAWLYDTIVGALVAKVANSVRPRGETGTVSGSIPFSVTDFTTSQRTTGESMAAWREFGNKYVAALKDKGLHTLNAATLRQVLQSKEFAETMFPKVTQGVWENVLDSMIQRAEVGKLEPGILRVWRDTRDSAAVEVPELDMADLADMKVG